MIVTGYIGEFEVVDDHRSGKIVVNLTGRLNKVSMCLSRTRAHTHTHTHINTPVPCTHTHNQFGIDPGIKTLMCHGLLKYF